MALPIRQQRSLWRIEDSLRQCDPGFATTMCTFAVFEVDGVVPEQERLIPRAFWGRRIVTWLALHAVRGGHGHRR